MKLIFIIGPQAVGKMTVGQELEKITGIPLFHNHMTIELVAPFFSYGTPQGRKLVEQFREMIFKEVAASDLPGLIFTYVWYFDDPADKAYVDGICDIFERQGGKVYFVELQADVEERLSRNTSEHRLAHKPTKRNISFSENDLRMSHEEHRLQSLEGEIVRGQYIGIDNTNVTAAEVAMKIKEAFEL